ncbi:MAG: alpha-amylase family glycosyl hydrolase [Pseudomonadota bacterium]
MPDDVRLIRSMPFGATLLNAQLTRFRLWAPDAAEVAILVKPPKHTEAQEIQMLAVKVIEGDPDSEQGWYQKDIECGAGSRYVYKVTNKQGEQLTVADPASRAQADSVHGDSIVVNPAAYTWRNRDWHGRPWHETVLYELHVGAFGGFNGVRERLEGLASMGITGIELMPIASFPGPRNWGYDGVLQFAPQYTYGTPDELKALVDEAHCLGMTIFLDVVYNHFGPDGNFLYHYASPFFCHDIPTPWGDAIDFTNPVVRRFYTENVLYWLQEYQFDGLRFDACHAIADKSWLFEVAHKVKQQFGPQRYVHLMAENDDNTASLLDGGMEAFGISESTPTEGEPTEIGTALQEFDTAGKFTAQWNDDGHHVLHSLLTGETEGYYSDYADSPAEKLARCLADGFIYQGQPSAHHKTSSRGEPSGHLPPTAFVLYLQNHDQIGNRPYGERLTTLVDPNALRAATALLLLSPQIPMLFMGEEFGATQPFMYFTSHENQELVAAIREGRRREFAGFNKFSEDGIAVKIPEANEEDTFHMSIPRSDTDPNSQYVPLGWEQQTRQLLEIRHSRIIPRLAGARTIETAAIGPAAVMARWRMADDMVLTIALNLAQDAVAIDPADAANHQEQHVIYQTGNTFQQLNAGSLPGQSFIALLEPA